MSSKPFTVAAVQAMPVFLDRDATIDKACDLIAEAGGKGAKLAVFPEAFVPTYPDWVWAIPAGEAAVLQQLHGELLENSVAIPSDATERLGRAARSAKVCVVIGVNERNVEASGASLYNTLLYIGPDGKILGKHRKLVPTGAERLVWAQGDGSTLGVYDLPFGRVGGLICWENYMPLARYAMYAWGTQIYVAATWDRGKRWLSTLQHIAYEGRVYVIGVCMPMRLEDIPDRFEFKRKFYGQRDEWINVGDSAIIDPDGEFIAGPVRQKEEILCAEIDPRRFAGSKWMLDVAGHYGRPDIFQLTVSTDARPMMHTQHGIASSLDQRRSLMAEHVTYFRYKVLPGKRQAVLDLFDKWEREQKPKAKGFIRSFVVASNDDSDELTSGVRWDSTENYLANSNRPEQGQWFRELRSNLVADPEWFNGTLIRETSA